MYAFAIAHCCIQFPPLHTPVSLALYATMNTRPIVKLAEKLQGFLEALKGKSIRVSESLCFSELENFDRHSTLESYCKFQVESTGWQFSGGHFHIYSSDARWAISTTNLEKVESIENGIEVLERYEKHTLRKTKIVIL